MSADFVKVAETKDIQPSNMKAVDLEGERVCIATVEGSYYAIGNICTHLGAVSIILFVCNHDFPTSFACFRNETTEVHL